jgi:predicted Zn-dependent protease
VVEVLTSPASITGGLTASLHFALGLAYFELGRYGDAAEQMRQCLAKRDRRTLSPINTDILTSGPYHCLARTLTRSGDLAGAEQAFLAGLKEKGREDEIKLDYAVFLREQNRPVDALNRLHEMVTADPKNIKAWRLGAEIALNHQEFLEVACDWTAEAIKQFPKDSPVIAHRAEALMLKLQPAEALIFWETAVERDPQPRLKAALLLCELIEDRILSHPEFYESEVGPIGRAFVDWYQRCLQMKAQEIVSRVNERLETLRTALPATAGLIEAAVSEAQFDSSAAAEPCLA